MNNPELLHVLDEMDFELREQEIDDDRFEIVGRFTGTDKANTIQTLNAVASADIVISESSCFMGLPCTLTGTDLVFASQYVYTNER